ncbi:MAG: ABC transporter transmembrane domain-containing protein, partial [Pseudomonadales bacterium]
MSQSPPRSARASSKKRPLQGSAETFKFLLSFAVPYRKVLFWAGVALIFTAAITLSIGQGVKLLIDNGFVAQSKSQLNQTTLMLMLMTVLMACGTYIRFYLVSWLGERVCADIRKAVFDHLVTLEPNFFEQNR